MYAQHWEDAPGGAHRQEFLHLLKFLWGGGPGAQEKCHEAQVALARLENELRKGAPGSDAARGARDQLQTLLRPIVARTERGMHPQGRSREGAGAQKINAGLHQDDLKIFKHLCGSLSEGHRPWAVPYWSSIPMPMQSMGNSYHGWKNARFWDGRGTPALSEEQRDRFQSPSRWPHPRLRALLEWEPAQRLALPWASPSLPWWPPAGPWKKGGPEKALIFSRFRAVPQTVAAFLSYELEACFLRGRRESYDKAARGERLKATDDSILALFHPSPWLAAKTDPLAGSRRSLAAVRLTIDQQLKQALDELSIAVRPGGRPRSLWSLLARLEARAGTWEKSWRTWKEIQRSTARQEGDETGIGQILQRWREFAGEQIFHVTPSELGQLAAFALEAPGMALGRALARHWSEALGEQGLATTLAVAWQGLRNYLDRPIFAYALAGRGERYPQALRKAVVEGNLEATLDEHLWIVGRTLNLEGPNLATELLQALQVRSGLFRLHELGRKDDTFSLRCHAALPFIDVNMTSEQGESSDRPLRTDEIRKAFNGPFWPHILVTTSIGQEGLDFHTWCRSVMHWDLCRNPVDLEQREGRIQRFGGLAVRRAVAKELGAESMRSLARGESPWGKLAELAQARLGDESGLCPWWVCPGADVRRYLFDIPTSEQRERYALVQEQRLLYRLVLGQPNQEDLLEVLARSNEMSPDEVTAAMITLSPWFTAHQR